MDDVLKKCAVICVTDERMGGRMRRMEQRDENGKLIYAERSNYGAALASDFPGPRHAVPRSETEHGVTRPQFMFEDWPQVGHPKLKQPRGRWL